MYDLIKQLNP